MNIESLKDTVAGLSLYDVKAAFRKAQNIVQNYTEMEAKVREATNNEPWGASSTLMNEIASGTFNYQTLNEIMPMIYRRFTEKSAEEWRQIYKALQLLEFLVKNGSEQVIDDARAHLGTIKMLRQFHYIDMNGKDQGINVRNRAKELSELLSDVEKIRAERKKARSNKNKYGGVEGGASLGFSGGMSGGFSSNSSSRYGGFGSDSLEFGGYTGNRVYGDGGGFGGASSSRREEYDEGGYGGGSSSRAATKFEEYDEYDDGGATRKTSAPPRNATAPQPRRQAAAAKVEPPKPAPVEDLLSLDDPEPAPAQGASSSKSAGADILGEFGDFTAAAQPAAAGKAPANDDDDFDDFVAAPTPANNASAAANTFSNFGSAQPLATSIPTTTPIAAPKPFNAGQSAGLQSMVGLASVSPAPAANAGLASLQPMSSQSTGTSNFQRTGPNYYTSVPLAQATAPLGGTAASTPAAGSAAAKPAAAAKGGDAFGNLWSSASAGLKKTSSPAQGPKLADIQKQKAESSIWGTGQTAQAGQAKPSGGLGDLLG